MWMVQIVSFTTYLIHNTFLNAYFFYSKSPQKSLVVKYSFIVESLKECYSFVIIKIWFANWIINNKGCVSSEGVSCE